MKRETLPTGSFLKHPTRFATCMSPRLHLPDKKLHQVQLVVRKIVELCYDSLIQAFLFFVEWLEFVILASSSAVCRGRRRDWARR